MDSILVAVDGSEPSARAARWAAGLAGTTGARLLLLHVHPTPGSETLGLGKLEREQVEETAQRIAEPVFATARTAIGGGTAAREIVSRGEVSAEIVAIAKREGAALIVMGTRGLSPVQELVLGSVGEKVIRHAHCPVTLVR